MTTNFVPISYLCIGTNGEDLWKEAALDLNSDTTNIVFRATHGGVDNGQPFSDIAIDEIVVST